MSRLPRAHEQIDAGERPERLVGSEEVAHLVNLRAAAQAGEAADQLDVGEIAGRQLVVVALAVQAELLDGPGPDPADADQAPAAVLRVVEVDAATSNRP